MRLDGKYLFFIVLKFLKFTNYLCLSIFIYFFFFACPHLLSLSLSLFLSHLFDQTKTHPLNNHTMYVCVCVQNTVWIRFRVIRWIYYKHNTTTFTQKISTTTSSCLAINGQPSNQPRTTTTTTPTTKNYTNNARLSRLTQHTVLPSLL